MSVVVVVVAVVAEVVVVEVLGDHVHDDEETRKDLCNRNRGDHDDHDDHDDRKPLLQVH